MNSRISDELLVPTKMLWPRKAKEIMQEAKQEDQKVRTAAIAETLILALNASNRLNEDWVSSS